MVAGRLDNLVLAGQGWVCTKCFKAIEEGEIAVSHKRVRGRAGTHEHPYHVRCFTYANGKPIFDAKDYVAIRRRHLMMVVRKNMVREGDVRISHPTHLSRLSLNDPATSSKLSVAAS